MDRQLQRADESQRGSRRWKRDWFPYEEYQVVHQSSMESLEAEGLVYRDNLSFREVRRPTGEIAWVNLRGRIECSDAVLIRVDKWLATASGIRNQLMVRGQWYSYHAWLRRKPRIDLLRYDNSHGESQLHRHFFDEAGQEIAVEPVAFDSLPRLDLLIREAVGLVRGTSIEDLHAATTPAT